MHAEKDEAVPAKVLINSVGQRLGFPICLTSFAQTIAGKSGC